jgi:hypothetical protein
VFQKACIALAVALLVVACVKHPVVEPLPPPDQPVPASEPRAMVTLRVDLKPGPDCEEAFDLALYANRAVDLIEWDDDAGDCPEREVRIRYLSNQISREELILEVQRHAQQASVTPETDPQREDP